MRGIIKTLLVGLLILSTSAAVRAQPELERLTVRGNRYFSERKIIAWSGLKKGKPVTPELITEAALNVLQRLADEGFYFCRIDSIGEKYSSDSTRVALTLYLDEGERLIFAGLDILGDTTDYRETFLPRVIPGKPLFHQDLESDLWNILTLKEEAGYPFARLEIKEMSLTGDSLGVLAKMQSGPRALLESVQVIGLKSTRPNVVVREARLSPGTPYSPSRVEEARHHIRKLPFIAAVSPPALVSLGSNRYDLLFQVEEARSNSFDGVVGYQPGSDGEEGVVTGLLDLSFKNLFGTGRKAYVHWERASQNQQALELSYEEPWVLGLPFNLWGSFRQEIRDSLYLERRISAGAVWPALDVLSLQGSVYQEEVLPDSAGEVYGIYRSTERGGAAAVVYDTRDFPENPTRGLFYRSSAAASVKDYTSTSGLDNVDLRHYETDAEISLPVIGRQIINLQVHGRYLQSDEDPIPQPDLYRLGGTRTLRGYREDQFLGYLVGWGSVEYRFWLDRESRVYAFFNQGYYEWKPNGNGAPQRRWPWGYGVGFRQGTRIGIIGFDFALGEEDVLSTAKVHFRLINRF